MSNRAKKRRKKKKKKKNKKENKDIPRGLTPYQLRAASKTTA